MSSTDTVVGVVGAVVLAGIMIGVFVYESNNVSAGPDAVATFDSRYAAVGITPFGDLDGDGTSNLNDTDMDGDGLDNDVDVHIAVTYTFTGSLAQTTGSASADFQFVTEIGAKDVQAYLNYTTLLPAPAPRAPNLAATIVDADGQAVATCAQTTQAAGSTAASCAFGSQDIAVGAYTATVETTTAGPAQSFELTIIVNYGHVAAMDPQN